MNQIPVTNRLTPAAGDAVLNSDLIRDRFGSYHVDVLRRDADTRVSALSSDDAGQRICRTFAITRFLAGREQVDSSVLQQIDEGGSIGATLRRAGIEVDKQTLDIRDVPISQATHASLQPMRLDAPVTLALHIYTLGIRRDTDAMPFAIIAELHHPDFLSSAQLSALFLLSAEQSGLSAEINALRKDVFQIGT
ncbi:MAG: hypothetical protein AAGA44_03965 [Pseudomonadota bacterium]